MTALAPAATVAPCLGPAWKCGVPGSSLVSPSLTTSLLVASGHGPRFPLVEPPGSRRDLASSLRGECEGLRSGAARALTIGPGEATLAPIPEGRRPASARDSPAL